MILLLIESAKFRAYLGDYSSSPVPFPDRKKSRAVQSPVIPFQIEMHRRFHPDVPVKKTWGMSPGEVAWANTIAQEAHGAEIEIMTEARMKAREAAIKRGKKMTPEQVQKMNEEKAPRSKNGNGNGHVRR